MKFGQSDPSTHNNSNNVRFPISFGIVPPMLFHMISLSKHYNISYEIPNEVEYETSYLQYFQIR